MTKIIDNTNGKPNTETPIVGMQCCTQAVIPVKKCGTCGVEYPKTDEYFFRKSKPKKYKLKEIYREICKECHKKKTTESRIIKRCKELGIERKDWEEWKRKDLLSREIFQLKDERLKGLDRPIRARILRKIREDNYKFTTIENYYKECTINRSKVQRKYNYKCDTVTQEIIRNALPDYYVANRLKKRVKDLPKEVIETARLIIKLKRELNITNIKI